MSYEEAGIVLGSLFGMYVAGWCAGYLLHVIKVFMEKI